MGARLHYAKVVDRELFYIRGGRLHPGLHNEVVVLSEPGVAGAFLIMRAWGDDKGTFTEQWAIESPGGTRVYESAPRELHIANDEHVERLEDEVADLHVEYTADDYAVVFRLDDRQVARVGFPIRLQEREED